ncbi:YitT family protein [Pontivivens ytuae]|uniref:YitT family protein n=1 Tax=Pontivivens ytuae TaxID=2789856 RepID=A0A7S9LS78_9RHOB|nr:YitT family protein [Pontivivens ytuae]QPH53995.1 YitT family protein [Pontivivens ytuae]
MSLLHRNNEAGQLARRHAQWEGSATEHTALEDGQGIAAGVIVTALGLALYQAAGLVTSGMAGLALVLSYLTNWDAGLLFWLLNTPFYVLAILRMGWSFTLKTFAAITALSALISLQGEWLSLGGIAPAYAAITGGVLIGFGLLGLFRHRASLGGVGILALYLQDRMGWKPGLVQLVIDLAIFALGLAVLPLDAMGWSLLGAVVLNLFLTVNHRLDRYIAR